MLEVLGSLFWVVVFCWGVAFTGQVVVDMWGRVSWWRIAGFVVLAVWCLWFVGRVAWVGYTAVYS